MSRNYMCVHIMPASYSIYSLDLPMHVCVVTNGLVLANMYIYTVVHVFEL